MNSWTVTEWDSLPYGEREGEIPAWAAERLAAVAQASPLRRKGGLRVLEQGRRALRAGQVVGIIAAANCSLEILPKIDGLGGSNREQVRARIRDRLIHMLAVALEIKIDAGAITAVGYQDRNLLEILIRLFADKMLEAARLGLPRRYESFEEDLPTLRGKLAVVRQVTVLAAKPQRLACRYDELSADIALNRIMKAAVTRLRCFAQSLETKRRLSELALIYADVSDVTAKSLPCESVVLDRTNERWRELLNLARLLMSDQFQTTSRGDGQGFSLLFDMSALFEVYVAKLLKRSMKGQELNVISQGGRLYCMTDVENGCVLGKPVFQTKPDILLKHGSAIPLIIDTKWKRLAARADDEKQGVLQGDVYQMMAYGRVYECSNLMLLYPHHAGLSYEEGIQRTFRITGGLDQLTVATIDIAQADGLDMRLRDLAVRCASVAAAPPALPPTHERPSARFFP